MFDRAYAFAFSPTGTSYKVARAVLEGLGGGAMEDVTSQAAPQSFAPGQLVVFAVPVFGGRVPAVALERLAALQGNGAFAAALVVYGNRAYEDALLELKIALEQAGFVVAGAAAFVAQHSIVPTLAAGRPNTDDLAQAAAFGRGLAEKLAAAPTPAPLAVPGNTPYKVFGGSSFRPYATERCTRCGACAGACPVGAIPADAPNETLAERCITCMHCVAVCPHKARQLPQAPLEALAARLAPLCQSPKQPELLL